MADLAGLERTVAATLSANNAERQQAEAALAAVERSSFDALAAGLLQLLRQSQQPPVRNMCAVMLRRRLTIGEPLMFHRMPEQLQLTVQRELIEAVSSEPLPYLKRQVADTVAELAQVVGHELRADGSPVWPELFQFLFTMPQDSRVEMRAVVFALYAKLADAAPMTLLPLSARTFDAYKAGLQDGEAKVRAAAAAASIKHSCALEEDETHAEVYQHFIEPWMQTLAHSLSAGEDTASEEILKGLVELAADFARFFQPRLEECSALLLSVGQSAAVDESLRRLAMQWFVNVCVDEEVMARRSASLVRNAIGVAVSLMLTVEDDPRWAQQEEAILEQNTLEDSSAFDAGEDALARVALSMRRKRVLPVIMPIIEEFLKHADWRYRFVGVSALGTVADLMELGELPVAAICGFFRDPHPRVGYAAIHAVGVVVTDFAPDIQQQHPQVVIEALIGSIRDTQQPRLQAQATSALFNFVEDGDQELSRTYIAPLMNALFEVIRAASRPVVAGCLTVIASMAGKVPDDFLPYYAQVMPFIVNVVRNGTSVADRPLRARAMEAATFVGMGMQREVFRPDARELMTIFLDIMKRDALAPDDPATQYMFNAWTRICTVLREEFAPYLQAVMPHVLNMAKIPIDNIWKRLAAQDGEDSASIQLDTKRMMLSIEDKVAGLNMLGSFVGSLGETGAYLPYLDETCQVLLPLLDNHVSEQVRSIAISSMPDVIQCAVSGAKSGSLDPAAAHGLFVTVMERLCVCMSKETTMELIMCLAGTMGRCIDVVGPETAPAWISAQVLQQVGGAVDSILTKSTQRMVKRGKRAQNSELDEEALADLESYNEVENQLNFTVSECMGSLARNAGAAMLPLFDALLPRLQQMAADGVPMPAQTTAIFIMDDVMEHAKLHVAPSLAPIMAVLLRFVADPRYQVRQGAAYGLGVAASEMGEHFAPYRDETARLLLRACEMPVRDPNDEAARDNCVAALARMIEGQKLMELVPLWLQLLPLTADASEGSNVYGTLVSLMEAGCQELLGQSMENLPRVVAVLAAAFGTDFSDDELNARIAAIMKAIAAQMPAATFEQLVASIPPQSAEKLRQIVSHPQQQQQQQ